ncbi:putative type VI secretion system protein [Escherichia coli]|uniref:Putative type VI secretion system protein n=1 Tax=Escherichia coli TaxID=562 RepID=A0A376VRN0_ECOLX|nr:putative type VI secretion system protein [Escherichia coli]
MRRQPESRVLFVGNTSFLLAANLAESFAKYRWCPNIIGPSSGGAVKDLPVHLYESMGQMQAKFRLKC